jgi:DNA-binding transcriptional MerR regulator
MFTLEPVSMSNTADTNYKIDELAKAAGVSPRTVRYYVQRGLLRAPEFKGRDTVYTGEHLLRLRGIKVLQERFLPLDAIQAELERLSAREIEELVARKDARPRTVETIVYPPHQHPYRLPGANEPLVPRVEIPVAPRSPSRGARGPRREGLSRFTLAPGLELTLADDADADTAELAEEVIKWVSRRDGAGGTK